MDISDALDLWRIIILQSTNGGTKVTFCLGSSLVRQRVVVLFLGQRESFIGKMGPSEVSYWKLSAGHHFKRL